MGSDEAFEGIKPYAPPLNNNAASTPSLYPPVGVKNFVEFKVGPGELKRKEHLINTIHHRDMENINLRRKVNRLRVANRNLEAAIIQRNMHIEFLETERKYRVRDAWITLVLAVAVGVATFGFLTLTVG